jgi:hypothetical protein
MNNNKDIKSETKSNNEKINYTESALRFHYTENPNISYLPMKYSDTETCMKSWTKSQQLGKGVFSSVYQSCNNTSCNYVMKVSEINNDQQYQMFERDQHFLFKLKGKEIAPEIEDAWICDDRGYIIMEKLDGDLKSTNVWFVADNNIKVYEWVWLGMINCLLKLSKEKIIHGDVKVCSL